MEFRTALDPLPSAYKINLGDGIITIGSCFADHTGAQLNKNKIGTLVNPFGTVYNPVSIHKLLSYAIDNSKPDESTYGNRDDLVFNYDFHSSFSSNSKLAIEKRIKEAIETTHNSLKAAKFVFITYGTSFIFERIENGQLVANCHKMDSKNFRKELLTQKKILESFNSVISKLIQFNPDLRIILTVSPVRHVKDSLELNSVSKATLRLSCNTLSNQYDNVEYFPAYEILLDDLRDYRFYESDLIHPSSVALEYIWDKFSNCYLSSDAQALIRNWKEIAKAISHRPFNSTSSSHQQFLKSTLRQLEELEDVIDVTEELDYVRKQITN